MADLKRVVKVAYRVKIADGAPLAERLTRAFLAATARPRRCLRLVTQ